MIKAMVDVYMKLREEANEVKINSARRAWIGLIKEEILSQRRNYIFHWHKGGEVCFHAEETLRAKPSHKV